MARFMFVVPPLTGHVNPTVGLGSELRARGHEVVWVTFGGTASAVLPADAEVVDLGGDLPEDLERSVRDRSARLRGAAALEFLWNDFLRPLAVAMIPGVEAAVDQHKPDVLIVDQQTFAGAVVARRRQLPWVTSATTSAELVDPFQGLPKVGRWVRDGLEELQRANGIDPRSHGDLRFSEHLIIAYTTEALTGPVSLPEGAGPLVMVGPSIVADEQGDPRLAADPDLTGWLNQGGPRVLVSLGTVSREAGERFFRAVAEALLEAGMRAVMVAPPDTLEGSPDHVLVRGFVPQLTVLDHVDAVVSHAGHNTVCESLSKGLPLLVAPIRDDQPIVADQVVRAGAGVRVRFGRARPAEVSAALASVVHDPALREGARRIQQSFRQAGGAPVAAHRLEQLVGLMA